MVFSKARKARSMKYCQNCGKQISNEAKYCEFCGGLQNSANNSIEEYEGQNNPAIIKMHCPKCKSYHIGPILESQSTEGLSFHSISDTGFLPGLTMLGRFSSKTQNNYEWLCQDCGKHFPNVETLFEKASSASRVPAIAYIFFIAALVIALVSVLMTSWINAIISSVAAILFFIISKLAIRKHAQLLQEAKYWKSLCFD